MAHCIPTYMLASGLIAAGMNWWQALVTILLGNLIVLVPILLNSHPGTKYGIPFPVFARAAYGTLGRERAGDHARARRVRMVRHQRVDRRRRRLTRSAVGDRRPAGASSSAPDSAATPRPSGSRFVLFWGLNILDHLPRHGAACASVENWAAPFVLVMTARRCVVWAAARGRRARPDPRPQPGKFETFGEFWPVFVPTLTAMIGFWSTLSLNMPDFTRFGAVAERAGGRPGRRAADDDDRVRDHGHPDHERDRHHLRQGDLGSGRARRRSSRTACSSASRCSPSSSRRSP